MLKRTIGILAYCLMAFIKVEAENNPLINKDGQVGLVSVFSAKSLGFSNIVITMFSDFASDKDYVTRVVMYDEDVDRLDTLHPISTIWQIQPNIAYGITNYFDLSISMPINFDVVEDCSPQGGIGDLKLTSKIRIPGKDRILDCALLTACTFPTGNKEKGFFPRNTYYFKKKTDRDTLAEPYAFYSSGTVDFDIRTLFTLNASWLQLHLNTGCIFSVNNTLDNVLVLNGAIEIRPNNSFALFTELTSESRFYNVAHGFKIADDPLWINPGISIRTLSGGVLTLSGGINLSSHKKIDYFDMEQKKRITSKIQPSWRVAVQFGWSGALKNSDSDRDMIFDKYDKCPDSKEDIDGFDDNDGCPDFDNDNDGIKDSLDKCADMAEDFDKVDDEDGCPDFDNDHDGIQDSVDKCIDVPEDIDGFNDNDGCPDLDNDYDGVPDSIDKCIATPEDKDGFQDNDGCPDIDNDLDGITDDLDKCPDLAGTKENSGCPVKKNVAKEIKTGKVILSGVAFEPKTARLVQTAYLVLDQLAMSLIAYPTVALELRAHTDASGDANVNMTLTINRATAVKDYLISKGIAKDRLSIVGKGDSEPIADNTTIPGRQLNNRVEIFRLN